MLHTPLRKFTRVLICFALFFYAGTAYADDVKIYLFKQTGCPNCARMEEFLDHLKDDFNEIDIIELNISEDDDAAKKFQVAVNKLSIKSPAVPLVLIGDYYYMGSRPQVLEEITYIVSSYRAKPYEDNMGGILEGEITDTSAVKTNPADLLRLPLIGDVRLGNLPLLASTALIAFIDGFNPCSLWVLTLVLGIALHSGKRLPVTAVGVVFLTVTSLIYGGFLFGAVKVVSILQYSTVIRVLLIVFVGVFAGVNIKDYFSWKKGISFTISETGKSTILQRLRTALNPSNGIFPILLGTVVLAGTAALIELPCTAGFPVLWAQLLGKFQVGLPGLWLYLMLYLVVYLLDEIIVLLAAVITLRRHILDESKGQGLKLVSGTLMASVCLHLVFFQDLLQSFWGIITIVAVTAVLIVVFRKVKQRMFGNL